VPGVCFWYGPALSYGGDKETEKREIKIFFKNFQIFEMPLRGALTAEPPGRDRGCIRWVTLRDPKVRPLATIGTEILAKNASYGTTNVCYKCTKQQFIHLTLTSVNKL